MKNKTKIYGNRSYYACLYFQIWFGAVFQNVPAVHKKPDPKELDNLVRTGEWLYLSKRDFEQILESDCGELKVQHSLTEAHIDIAHSKTNVRVAAQTFSTKTANI